MVDALSGFYTFLRSLFYALPQMIQVLFLAIFAVVLVLGVIKLTMGKG